MPTYMVYEVEVEDGKTTSCLPLSFIETDNKILYSDRSPPMTRDEIHKKINPSKWVDFEVDQRLFVAGLTTEGLYILLDTEPTKI